MMYDAQNQFSAAQALTATAVSTNVIDLGADRDIGKGEPLCVVLCTIVAADFTTANETYQIDVQSGSTATPTAVKASRVPVVTASNATSDLGLGKIIVIPLPHDMDRFIRLNYTLGGTTPTWTVTAFLAPMSMVQSDTQFADALTITG